MIATEASIEFRAATEYLFGAIAAPASTPYTPGMRGITVWCESGYIRATAGGTGAAKCAGNYAGSMIGNSLPQPAGGGPVYPDSRSWPG